MTTLNIKRTRQLFAFNQYVNLFLDGKFHKRLKNGDNFSMNVDLKEVILEARSCFGNEVISIEHCEKKIKDITIQFSVSDLYFLLSTLVIIVLATYLLNIMGYANINFSIFIFIFSGFFIIRNRKKLRIIKNINK